MGIPSTLGGRIGGVGAVPAGNRGRHQPGGLPVSDVCPDTPCVQESWGKTDRPTEGGTGPARGRSWARVLLEQRWGEQL